MKRTVEIEVYTDTHFITGEVEYNIEIDDSRFDYEYGSISGVAGSIDSFIEGWDDTQLKVYDIDVDEAENGPISNYKFTEEDNKLILIQLNKDLPTYEQLIDEAKCP